MATLEQYLKKVGVNSFADLTDEERVTYKEWEAALSGRKLTDEDVANFLDSQMADSMGKLITTALGDREDTFLKMKVCMISLIKAFLASPEIEKKVVEANLSRL